MPKFKYNGDHKKMVAWKYDFSGGKAVEVTDPYVLRKLHGNNHFDEVKAKSGRPRKQKDGKDKK